MRVSVRQLAAVGISASLLLVACGGDDDDGAGSAAPDGASSATEGGTEGEFVSGEEVVVRLNSDWTDFDVQKLPSISNVQLVLPAYDRLVDFDGETQVPYLAESWEITPTSVTFKLKEGPTCADGTPVTASVVEDSFKRLIDPETKFANLTQFFGPGELSTSSDDEANTFTFMTDTPFSNLIYAFADPSASIICPAGIDDPSIIATEMPGSGPYVLESATHNDEVVFTLRDDWAWGPYGTTAETAGMPETIVYKIIPEESTAANLLLSGDLDIARIAGTEVDRLRDEGSLNYYEAPLSTSALMVFNERPGQILQEDQALRQALSTAIDPAEWRQTANNGYGEPATSYLSDHAPCFNPETRELVPTPDIEAAREVLTDAGWTFENGSLSQDGEPLRLTVLGNTGQNSGPEYLAAQFTELGVDVNLVKVDFATYAANLNASDFSWDVTVAQLGSINNFATLPSTFVVPFASGKTVAEGGRNLYNVQDELVEEYIAEANAATGEEACDAWGRLQERYLERSDFLPLGTPVDQWFTTNVEVNASIMEPITWRVLAD